MKRTRLFVSILLVAILLFAGSISVFAEGAQESKAPAAKFTYEPVKNTTGRTIRIAVLCVQNNPFWFDVLDGIQAATNKLRTSDYNAKIDLVTFDKFTGQDFADAIDACVIKKYDAITTVGVADTIVPAIDRAVKAGIPVYTFNSQTTKPSQRTAFVGQDLYSAGVKLGKTLGELLNGKGKVAIITGLYNVDAHEKRRLGILEGLSGYPGIKVVGTVENHDSADEAYAATKDFITANPDLAGIAVTAGGPHGAAKAIEELGKKDQIQLVCFDTTDEIVGYLRKGIIKSTISQDPFGQGADPIILAYNHVVKGKPDVTGTAFTKMDVYTPANVNEFFPVK